MPLTGPNEVLVKKGLEAIRNRVRALVSLWGPKLPAETRDKFVIDLTAAANRAELELQRFDSDTPVPPPEVPIERRRPYTDDSPWNTPITSPTLTWASGTSPNFTPGTLLTGDPTQYTYPVYFVDNNTPLVPVTTDGWYSRVYNNGKNLDNQRRGVAHVPLPAEIEAARGTDGQVIIINRDTGDEYGFWQFRLNAAGGWASSNGYSYNVAWSAVPPPPDGGGFTFVSRGAGVPYHTGLIRPWEIDEGVIRHAIAFAYPNSAPGFVYPATKSDGNNANGLPEGARLMLDPSFDIETLNPVAKIVAKALQTYGMYNIDVSGSHKIMFEYENTAKWNGRVTRTTVSSIPLSAFRRVS